MVLYMYVIISITEFRYSRIIIWISCSHVKCTKEIVSSLYSIIYMYNYCNLLANVVNYNLQVIV